MIGSPATSSATTPGSTQSGTPTRRVTRVVRPSTASDASPYQPTTRAGCPCLPAAAGKGAVPVGVIPPVGVDIASSCAWTSSADCQRSAGFFSRHRITTSASPCGTVVRYLVTGVTDSVTWAASMACGVGALNGVRPVSIS